MASSRARYLRQGTSRGAHIRALHAALCEILSIRLSRPVRPGGEVALRDHIAALERAYPVEFGTSRTTLDLEHYYAEEEDDDGETVP